MPRDDTAALAEPLLASPLAALRPVQKGHSRFYAAAAFLSAFLLYCAHRQTRPSAFEPSPIHGYPLVGPDTTCAVEPSAACGLRGADLVRPPQDLFRLQPVNASVEVGRPLLLEIVAAAEEDPECLLRSSTFVVHVSGTRIQRAQLKGESASRLIYAVDIDEPGEYRIEAFLRLFNYPLAVCAISGARAEGRYIDRIVAEGNRTVVAQAVETSLPGSLSSSRRPCEYGDLYDLRGAWLEPPIPGTTMGVFEKRYQCALAPLPTPVEALERARSAGIRWLRFIGDSNSRYLYESFPLVNPFGTDLRHYRQVPRYNLRSSCAAFHDPPSAFERNWRVTRRFCRVGLADGDAQDDIVITWEWFTPVHEPPLEAYFADKPTDYFANTTLEGLFSPLEQNPRDVNMSSISTVLSDRPDLLALRGGDRVFLSYGSHASSHTRDDMHLYIDEVVAAAERLRALEAGHLTSPQRRLSFALSTAKTCRKFKNVTQVTTEMLQTCHSDNFRDKNLAIMRELAARGLAGPNGESLPPERSHPPVPLDVLDFWHTTEPLEDYMTDKVHFGPGVYFLHSRIVATSVFAGEVWGRTGASRSDRG
ncbi:hypothetical protein JCM3770_000580 [Rhodotorula araucariae]